MRLKKFKISNYRNVIDTDWIDTSDITAFVGPNEAGKSNLFEALYCLNPYVEGATYDTAEDWPVDNWKSRKDAKGKPVCQAIFSLSSKDIESLFEFAAVVTGKDDGEQQAGSVAEAEAPTNLPKSLNVFASKCYGYQSGFLPCGQRRQHR